MPLVPRDRQMHIVATVIARAEEQGSVDLLAAAEEFEVKPEELLEWIETLVGLERRLGGDGGIIGNVHAYSAEDGVLTVTQENWLRDMQNVPPTVGEAVRLLIIATQFMSVMGKGGTSDALRSAVRKLEAIVGTTYANPMPTPDIYELLEQNIVPERESRTLIITYVNNRFEVREREIEPHDVYCVGGRWYVTARDPEDDIVKEFRLDRISAYRNGTRKFIAPKPQAIPETFDLSSIAHRLVVRVRKGFLDAKPTGVVIGAQTPLDDGRIEAHLTVYGERHLDHVLVAIGPDAEVVAPEELRSRRATHAAALLDHLG